MREMVKGNQFKVDHCNRCGDEKKVNKFGLCKVCQSDVDHEYNMLFESKTREY